MKNRLNLIVGLMIGFMLLAYMFAFQVRYDQVAVLTTFDKAGHSAIKREGLHFKVPWPIQKIRKYSTRIHLLEHRLEQVSTGDGKSVVVRSYLAWKIHDPLKFFVKLQNTDTARDKLAPLLSGYISGTIGRYRMDEMVNTDPDQVKLEQIESEALSGLADELASLEYGIEALQVGIQRLVLPQENTQQVFEAMRQTRQRLAANTQVSGQAQADAIVSQANSAKRRILAFAERRAQAIRAEGIKEAAGYYSAFRQDESLAIFLRRIKTLEKVLPHNTTFIMDANQLSLQELLEPNATPRIPGRERLPAIEDAP